MRTQFRIWTAGLACTAVLLTVTPFAVAQAPAKGALQEEFTRQQNLAFEGSQKIADASNKLQDAMRTVRAEHDYSKTRQMISEADKTMADGIKQLSDAQKLQTKLLQDIRRTGEAGGIMMQGARLMRKGMAMIMRDENALSTAQRITREGQSMLERGRMMVAATPTAVKHK
ncbi:MAG: hypothetical protein WBG50_28880 [Desulfomonilaceae bacterium]